MLGNMESLVKSLMGKGQEHVYKTMENLIKDAEKVENIEFDLKEGQILLEKSKRWKWTKEEENKGSEGWPSL